SQVALTAFEGYSADLPIQTIEPDNSFANGAAVRIFISAGGCFGDQSASNHSISSVQVAPAAVTANPTDIALSNNSINQGVGVNAVVGTLSSTDPDVGNTFTYTLVAGVGDTHNTSFNISGASLRANDSSALTAGSYSVS